jgi:gamma-glutamyltranspeptidase/glutathione hydrolase
MRRLILVPLAVLAGLLAGPSRLSAQQEATARRQMIAASHPMAAEAGLAVLRRGGSAVDAAIAAQAMMTLVEPQSSGIGGGALLLHWKAATRTLSAWDGRETAPAAATPALFLRHGRPMGFLEAITGGRPVGVPGTMRMLEAAHRAEGRLPWAGLFDAAIAAAGQGFPISARLHAAIGAQPGRLRADAAAAALYLAPDGSALPIGATLRNPALAATLRAIAADGADALHRGPIAEAILAAVRNHPTNPGLMTAEDLAGYRPIRRDALCGPYRAVIICGFPPPSSGGVAILQILGVLAHQDMAQLDPRGADHAHLLVEAGRLAFADRNRFLADGDFVAVPVAGLLDRVYLAIRAQPMGLDRALPQPIRSGNPLRQGAPAVAPQPPQPERGTAHVSVVDAAGNVVSLTTTVEAGFGAGILAAGFVLNNELTDFSFLPERDGRPIANRVEGGKRPRSSMSPTIVFDRAGAPVLALGSAGGERIIGHVAQTLVAMIDNGLSPAEAVALPRIAGVHENAEIEQGGAANAALATALEARGFPVTVRPNASGLQVIEIRRAADGTVLIGAADPRREGAVLGD